MFQQLLKLCFVTILFATRNGSATVVIVKDVIGMATNFSDIVPCVTWKNEDKDVTLPMLVLDSSTGVYKCTTSEDIVLFVAYEIMTFVFVSDPAIYQEKVSLNCYTRFWPKNFVMTTSLVIFDQKNNKLKDSVLADVPTGSVCENECFYDMETNTPGEFPHTCNWNITIEHEGKTYKDGLSLPRVLRVYMPVRNVRVNRTETKLYEVVECYADGYPEPSHFQWTCRSGSDVTGKGWSTQGHRISFLKAKEYKCTCTAFNMGVAEVHSSEWSGVIVAESSDEEEEGGGEGGEDDEEETATTGGADHEGDVTDRSVDDKKQVTKKKNKTGGKKKGKKKTDTKVKPDKKSPVGSGSPSDHDTVDPLALCSLTLLISGVIVQIAHLLRL